MSRSAWARTGTKKASSAKPYTFGGLACCGSQTRGPEFADRYCGDFPKISLLFFRVFGVFRSSNFAALSRDAATESAWLRSPALLPSPPG